MMMFQLIKMSVSLSLQIQAYLDNVFDVAALLEDVEQKNFALEAKAEAQEQLSVEKVWKSLPWLIAFLDASSQICKRVCKSVRQQRLYRTTLVMY